MAQTAVQTKSKKGSKSAASASRTKKSSQQNTFVNSPASNERPVNAFYAAGPVMNLAAPIQAKFETGQVDDYKAPETATVQTKLAVGAANDSYEREADAMSDTVVQGKAAPSISRVSAADLGNSAQRMEDEEPIQTRAIQREAIEETTDEPIQALPVQRQSMEDDEAVQPLPIQRQQEEPEESVQTLALQRLEREEEAVQAKGRLGQTGIPRSTEEIIRNPGIGEPIQPNVRQSIEPHLGADLSGVRVHTGSSANQATASLNARAFTHGNDVFLGNAESSNDVGLMAHETTHVVQQGAVPAQSQPAISATAPKVQRLFSEIGEYINDYARYIPGFTLFTVIIGFNPLIGARVDRNAVNLIQGFMELVPFGAFIFDKLRENSILQSAFEWVSGELARLDLSVSRIERTLDNAWEDISFTGGFDYNLNVLQRHFGLLLRDVTTFALSLVTHILQLIKDAAIGLAENLLADNAGWSLIKKVLHYDPLKGEEVTASTVEILEDFLLLIGKEQELEQMRERGTLEETAAWLDTQLGTFQGLLLQLAGLFSAAWDAIQPQNLPELPANLQNLATQTIGFLQGVWDFAVTVALTVLQLIKDALLGWLSTFATDIPGYHLLTVILEKDIFTQDIVLRNATNLIRGFMSLMPGGEQQFQQMQETGVIADAAGRIESIMTSLGISWAFVQELFLSLWESLTIEALLVPVDAFMRILARFAEPIARLFAFVVEVIKVVLELILKLMNFPSEILARIISNSMQAFEDIKRDPIGFLKHMLEAVKLGFTGFFNNILQYLMDGVTGWFFAQLGSAGIEPPAEITLETALDVVMQVLGITIDKLWEKLADKIGQDRVDQLRGAIDQLVGIWNFIRDVTERGIVAVWEYIEAQISNLWNMVIEQVRGWVVTRVIERVVAKLLSMLDPTGIMAVVNSFMAFFNAVQSAIEYMREMLMIVDDYVSTIASVARGEVQPGADKMEQGLANSLPVAIGFLANQVGLGNIGDQIQVMIEGVRAAVDEALTWLVDRAVSLGQSMLRALGMGGENDPNSEGENESDEGVLLENLVSISEEYTAEDSSDHRLSIGSGDGQELIIASRPLSYTQFINSVDPGNDEAKNAAVIVARTIVGEFYRKRNEPYPDGIDDVQRRILLNAKRTDLNQILNRLWIQTNIIFGDQGDIPTGDSAADAIPITWYKDLHNQNIYPPIYLIGDDGERFRFDIYDARETLTHPLQRGLTFTVGVDRNRYEVREGRNFLRGRVSRGTTADQFRYLLGLFEVDLGGLHADHVLDLNFGGDDVFANIWPLDSGANTSAGARQNNQVITYRDSQSGQIRAITAGHPTLIGKYFLIETIQI